MLITKEQQEQWLLNYIDSKRNQDNCIGFIDGVDKAVDVISKHCIDKHVAIAFAQHLLKDYSTIEVTQETLNNFLNKK
jgi:hypothetical protein